MAEMGMKDNPQSDADKASNAKQRRALLKKLGRFAVVSAPAAAFVSCAPGSSRALKTRIGPVDGDAVLAAVKALRISRT